MVVEINLMARMTLTPPAPIESDNVDVLLVLSIHIPSKYLPSLYKGISYVIVSSVF